ncbi:MAG: protoheme IX farnesyltransferase [Bdellovibrionaceae bacterium]|nr:protoheme IX farnesyltransferase [Bdellovibrionales bacterium]MCB9086232.1 protoheme IX farnesyltransferase [Pseudobdellovibrionaceae bacterium]
MKSYLDLTKTGIVVFVLLSGLAGYFLSFPSGSVFSGIHLLVFMVGLYLISAGSFALNQAQEWERDSVMDRTKGRPIPAGKLKSWQAWTIGICFVGIGTGLLYSIEPLSAFLGLLTVLLYNGFYTLFWKRRWAFGAVPGAIPGAMPAVIGYSVHSVDLLEPGCIYLFLIMFLWQMPHFWCLAIRYREDYERGGFPVLASVLGTDKTLFHIGLYVLVYIGVALVSPWFIKTHILYLLLVVPFAFKVLWEFYLYYRQEAKGSWIRFFLWVNFSLLAFMGAPVFDRLLVSLVGG